MDMPKSVSGDAIVTALAAMGIPNRFVISVRLESAHFGLDMVEIVYRRNAPDGSAVMLANGTYATETHQIPVVWP